MICTNCKNKLGKDYIKSEPNRHATSPSSINRGVEPKNQYFDYFCNKECRRETDRERYVFWAIIDRNASDSECFVHDHFEVDSLNRRIRVGTCKITNKEVRVEPLQPGDNSGQPIECYEHFELRSNYR